MMVKWKIKGKNKKITNSRRNWIYFFKFILSMSLFFPSSSSFSFFNSKNYSTKWLIFDNWLNCKQLFSSPSVHLLYLWLDSSWWVFEMSQNGTNNNCWKKKKAEVAFSFPFPSPFFLLLFSNFFVVVDIYKLLKLKNHVTVKFVLKYEEVVYLNRKLYANTWTTEATKKWKTIRRKKKGVYLCSTKM